MTNDKLNEIYFSSFANGENYGAVMDFARALLFECAKTVCINCKDGNVSVATKESHRRIHKLSAMHEESCRAVSFFLEGE